jgi:hypothetical protein
MADDIRSDNVAPAMVANIDNIAPVMAANTDNVAPIVASLADDTMNPRHLAEIEGAYESDEFA